MHLINTISLFEEERTHINETNDCVVRAIAIAFDLSYKQAHQYCTLYLRRAPRKGVYTLKEFNGKDHLSEKVIPYAFNKSHFKHCMHSEKIDCTNNSDVGKVGMYLKKFLKKCDQSATYVVLSSGHAYCVKGGKVYGNPRDDRTYVKLAYKLKES